jgi:hypothetical protein
MALTRKSLKAMGLTDEQVDSIVEMHTETVDGLKDKLKAAEEKANKLDDVEKELNDLKANSGDDYKAKYEAEKKAFADYKADQTAKETKAAKEKAVKAYFEGKNITGANLDIAMRGCRDEIGAIELDGDKIKDTAALDALVSGTFAGLVVTKSVHGAQTANPPANNGGKSYKTKEEILAIKDRTERQNAIAENHEMFGF